MKFAGTVGSGRWRRRAAVGTAAFVAGLAVAAATQASAQTGSDRGGEDAGGIPASAGITTPPQLHQLDFMLGTLNCTFNTGVTMRAHLHPTLGGAYYQFDYISHEADGKFRMAGRWIIGWSTPDNAFEGYYVDTGGNQGTQSATGVVDGKLSFVGPVVLSDKVKLLAKDDYQIVGPNHFTVTSYVQIKGAWTFADSQDCYRS